MCGIEDGLIRASVKLNDDASSGYLMKKPGISELNSPVLKASFKGLLSKDILLNKVIKMNRSLRFVNDVELLKPNKSSSSNLN